MSKAAKVGRTGEPWDGQMVEGVSEPTQHSGQLSQRFKELRAGRTPRCSRPGDSWQPWNQTLV